MTSFVGVGTPGPLNARAGVTFDSTGKVSIGATLAVGIGPVSYTIADIEYGVAISFDYDAIAAQVQNAQRFPNIGATPLNVPPNPFGYSNQLPTPSVNLALKLDPFSVLPTLPSLGVTPQELDPTGNAQKYLDNLPMMTGVDTPAPGVPQSQSPFTSNNNSFGPFAPTADPRPGTNSAPSGKNSFTYSNNSMGPFAPVGEPRPGTNPGFGPGSAGDPRAPDRFGAPGSFGTSGATQSGNPTGHNVGYNAGYGDDYSGAENNGTGSSYGVAKPTHYSPDPDFLGGIQIQNPSYTPTAVVDLTAPTQVYSQPTPPAIDPSYGTIPVSAVFGPVFITPQEYYDLETKPATKPATRPRPVPVAPVRAVAPPVMVPALVYVPGMGYTDKFSPIDAAGAVAQAALDKGLSPAAARAQAMAVAAQKYHVNPYDPNLQMRIANTTGTAGGKSDHTNSSGPSGNGGNSYHGVTTVGDHWGHDSEVTGDKDNGWGGHPVLLDLLGNGLSIDTLNSSSQFLDLDGDGYQHRTAWAGDGNGVLVLDADGDGKISRSNEFVFTEWDQTADSDLDALKSVFDTNHNGLLDAGDDRWSEFKIMVDGQLVSLASLGIASIGLTPRLRNQ